MKVDDIEIHAGQPDFDFTPVRRLEVKCEATNALMPAPTVDEANGRLRAMAAKVGANAVVNVEYNSGVSFTSWKSLKATGLAVQRLSDEVPCEVCAEMIKRAAIKCRYCGSERVPTAPAITVQPAGGVATPDGRSSPSAALQEPLRENNNPAIIIGLVILGLAILGAIIGAL